MHTEEVASQFSTDCNLRYAGQYFDKESGLHYNRFRYYDPESAQYLSTDPIGLEGGLTPQSYVHNPNGWIDPLGLNAEMIDVWHLTNKKGFNAITSGKDIVLKTSKAARGTGVFFTTKDPSTFDSKKLIDKLGIKADKATHYIKTQVPKASLKSVGNNPYKVFSPENVKLKAGTWEGGTYDRKTGVFTKLKGLCK